MKAIETIFVLWAIFAFAHSTPIPQDDVPAVEVAAIEPTKDISPQKLPSTQIEVSSVPSASIPVAPVSVPTPPVAPISPFLTAFSMATNTVNASIQRIADTVRNIALSVADTTNKVGGSAVPNFFGRPIRFGN